MKRLAATLAIMFGLLCGTSLVFGGSAAAVDVFGPCTQGARSSDICTDANNQNPSGPNPVVGVIKVIINVVALIIGIAAVLIIVVSGIRLVTSSGDTNAMAGARRALLYALIGLVVAALAEAIVAFVLNKLS